MNPISAQQLGKHDSVAVARRVWMRLRNQHNLRPSRDGPRKRGKNKADLIDRAEMVWANDYGYGPKRDDQTA